jgi:hypothetical protein
LETLALELALDDFRFSPDSFAIQGNQINAGRTELVSLRSKDWINVPSNLSQARL